MKAIYAARAKLFGLSGLSNWGALLVAGLCTTILVPWQVAEAKPKPPLVMTAEFDSGRPALNVNEVLRIKLTTTEKYENLKVKVDLPPEIALISGRPQWQGVLPVGKTQEIVLMVMLMRTGRYSVTVDAFFDPAESAFESARMHLNVIAEPRGVQASTESFMRMDMQRARTAGITDDSAFDVLDSYEVPTPAGITAPPAIPEILAPAADEQDDDSAPTMEGVQPRSTTITVTGKIYYQDTAGQRHPIRWAKLEVMNVKGGANTVIGRGYSGTDGAYSIRAVSAVSRPDIQLWVYAAIANDQVAKVGADLDRMYRMQSNIHSNYNSALLEISLTTGQPVSGSASDSDSARIFSVLDAVLQASADAYALRNNQLMPLVRVVYPGSSSFYRPSENSIHLLRFDALDWDVIFHEYGHFLADKGAATKFDNSLGGAHSGGSTIPLHGKDKGVRLAWSEGFATWFAIMAQIQPTQNLLTLPGVPNSGNRFYQDTEDANLNEDLETPTSSDGYSSGNSIQGLLYDLCDRNADQSSTGLSRDYISVPPKYVWDVLNSGAWDNVGKFYNRVCAIIGMDIPTLFGVSEVFAMNNIAPELKYPAEDDIVSSSISPVFTWLANGDPTAGYGHNRFALVLGNRNFSQILAYKTGINETRYSFTSAEWQALVENSDETGTFQWGVIGYNDQAPRMPPAGGLGGFLSNKHSFKVRAYHIRLRWVPEGSDIDLHLRPPSGASYSGWRYTGDCYWDNRNPDWGVAGDSRDNPHLDRDCTRTGTEENITLDTATEPGTYKVLVHYYFDHNAERDQPAGPSTVRVDIYHYGRWLAGRQTTLGNSGNTPSTGDLWVPFTFSVGHSGVTFVNDTPETLTRGSAMEDDGYGLPDEFFDKNIHY